MSIFRESVDLESWWGIRRATARLSIPMPTVADSEDPTNATSRFGEQIGTLALSFRATDAPSPIQAAAVFPVSTWTLAAI
jgi:hypothetical protein